MQTVVSRTTNPGAAEDALVERAQAGDNRAFDQLAERYSTRLRRVLFRITRDCEAAWDAVQEALMRAWQNIHRFEGRSRFYTWLTRIGINEAYRAVRRPVEESLDDDESSLRGEVPDLRSRPDEALESREFLTAVEEALTELPADHQTAVRLRDVEGLSTREASEALGIGERALKSRLHRGRMALREALDDYFTEGYAR